MNGSFGLCEGDCGGVDLACESGLTCYNIYSNGPRTVPGCSGQVEGSEDYCTVVPDDYLNFISGSQAQPLERCQGNCDDDSNCAGNLECFLLGPGTNVAALEPVPGCCGLGRRSVDYCYDPSDFRTDSPATSSPTKSPTSSPITRSPSKNPSRSPSSSPSVSPKPDPVTTSPTKYPTRSLSSSTVGALVPSPNCLIGGYTCLQNQDYGIEDTTQYKIDLSLEVLDPSNADAYLRARARWAELIPGDLPSYPGNKIDFPYYTCNNPHPSFVDDLHICGRDENIDGPGSVLGSAGPIWARANQDTGYFTTIAGIMRFDVADIEWMVQEGIWEGVILHEMGHVIGIGTAWNFTGIINNEIDYQGENGIRVWNEEWGCTGTPPVEKDFGPGTRASHWDEECLQNELMTGFVDSNMPISALTIASLDDIGYVVDYNAADEYDGSDTTCCTSSIGYSPSEPSKPPLSDLGRATAVAYGREVLNERQHHTSIFEQPQDENQHHSSIFEQPHDGSPHRSSIFAESHDDKLIYVGNRIIVVLIEEDGFIYDVHVTL